MTRHVDAADLADVKGLLPPGGANLDALRKLRADLRGALEMTNADLQTSVLKCVRSRGSPSD